MNCFDVVDAVVQEANERFKSIWVLNTMHYDVLKQYCEIIDSLAEEFDGAAFEVEVDEIEMTVSVKMECGDMTIKKATHNFYRLVAQTESVNFSTDPETGNLVVEFVFPSVWERAV